MSVDATQSTQRPAEAIYLPQLPIVDTPMQLKKKRLRHSFSLKFKVKDIASILEIQQANPQFHDKRVLRLASMASGVPISTLDKWMRKRAILLSDYENQKMWKRLRRIGGGRPPVFPLSEKNVAKL